MFSSPTFAFRWKLSFLSLAASFALHCAPQREAPAQETPSPESPSTQAPPVTDLASLSAPLSLTPASTHLPRFLGRGELHAGGYRFAWPGTGVQLRFRGSALYLELTDAGENRFLVLVDGQEQSPRLRARPGRHWLEIVSGLPPGEHTVTFYKLTEPVVGETTVHTYALDPEGVPLPSPAPPTRRIEILGDSISAGYGNEGPDASCPFSPETENHFLTYGAILARELQAELSTLAWSGKGVFSNRGSTIDQETLPVLWKRSIPQDPASIWDFLAPAPQLVLLNLGTNDFAPEVPDVSPFEGAFASLVEEVRERYPTAQIYATLGPLLNDSWPPERRSLSTVRQALQNVVAARKNAGDTGVHFFEFGGLRTTEGLGCDYHPSVLTHQRMAQEFLSALPEDFAW